jgi:tropomyosin-1
MATNTMDAIKKKMQAMRLEKENAFDKADQLEHRLIEQKNIYEKQEEEINTLHKRIVALGVDVELARSQLRVTTDKLEAMNRQLANAESEVQTLTKRVRSLEEEYEQTECRLQAAIEKLDEATKAADESERGRKVLESRTVNDEERIAQLQRELEATVLLGEESDRKFEEAAHQLAVTEVDLERGDARLEAAEAKILELEEELKIVGNNMKSLEIFEQEAMQRGTVYEEHIRDLTSRLKDAETRATDCEQLMIKLQKEVDRLEDALAVEKEKYKLISIDLDTTFTELTGF